MFPLLFQWRVYEMNVIYRAGTKLGRGDWRCNSRGRAMYIFVFIFEDIYLTFGFRCVVR